MNPITKSALYVMVVALAILAGIQTYTVVHFAQQPLVITDAKAVDPRVQVGDDLLVNYTAHREVLCKTDADIFVLRASDHAVASGTRRIAGVIRLGITASWIIPIQTSHLVVGKYVLRVFVHSDCGDRLHTIEVPDIDFEVVD